MCIRDSVNDEHEATSELGRVELAAIKGMKLSKDRHESILATPLHATAPPPKRSCANPHP